MAKPVLVVPVVSTTFASYARLFGHLDKEALGWLLIDEAGQATPQNAVGALWRTQHAVVVGDPLQLEPVTTLPFRVEQAIRNELGATWAAASGSTQGNVKFAYCIWPTTESSYTGRSSGAPRSSGEDVAFPRSRRRNVTSSPHPTRPPAPHEHHTKTGSDSE
jgi:AAA domain